MVPSKSTGYRAETLEPRIFVPVEASDSQAAAQHIAAPVAAGAGNPREGKTVLGKDAGKRAHREVDSSSPGRLPRSRNRGKPGAIRQELLLSTQGNSRLMDNPTRQRWRWLWLTEVHVMGLAAPVQGFL